MVNCRRWLGALPVFALLACGGAQNPPSTPVASPPDSSAAEQPVAADSQPIADDAGESAAAEPSSDAVASEPATSKAPDQAPEQADVPARKVKYIVTPGALEVEVEGVRFAMTADPVKAGGGWGVRVKAVAKVKDGKAHQLLNPDNGPLAFAGSVTRGGTSERFGDKRSGDDVLKLKSSKASKFSRQWPDKSSQPLKKGDELQLEVGLWGIGDDATTRRPMRDFVLVKLKVGNGKPIPVLLPPASAGKK